MKTKTYLRVITFLVIPFIVYFLSSGFKTHKIETSSKTVSVIKLNDPPTLFVPKDFTNFILNESYGHTNSNCTDAGTNWQLENFLDEYRAELKFNGVHMYDFFEGSDCLGLFASPLWSGQISKMNTLIGDAHTYGLKAIFQRSNLSMLCTSQRLIYEVTPPTGNTTTNYGFCYSTTRGKYEEEQDGTTSIHACISPASCNIEEEFDAIPQNICENIYENMQHTDLPLLQLQDRFDWFMKPRMKIKQSDYSPSSNTPVVTIRAIAFDGNTPYVAEKTILVKNFSPGSTYDGSYVEKYYNNGNEIDMSVPGNTTNGLGRGYQELNPETNCHVDFEIFWHGNVDVWVDKLTVDDVRANGLFQGLFDEYMDTVLINFGGSGSGDMDIFFCDELVYSNIEATKYVLNFMRNHPNPSRLSVAGTNGLNVYSMRKDDWGFEPFLSQVHPDYFQLDCHRFFGWREPNNQGREYHDNFYPNNITPSDSYVPTGNGMEGLGWAVPPADYNNSLQTYYMGSKTANYDDEGTLIYQIRLAREQINEFSPGTRFTMQPQLQAWIKETKEINGEYDEKYDEGNREPTTEEYEMQAMLAIAHGADALCWFWFNSFSFIYGTNDSPVDRISPNNLNRTEPPFKEWYMGLINEDASHRTENMWGENKWDSTGRINKKILDDWKPILDEIVWDDGFSVHSQGADHKYINDIQSIYRDATSPFNYTATNIDGTEYWEMGFFEPAGDGDGSFSKYFIMVNRRCVPEIPTNSGNGDLRQLKVRFDGTGLEFFNNWSVVDLETKTVLATFPKTSTSYYDLGYFMPGEGRLFKIVPTFTRGGTLVADETITGTSFVCSDTVYNGGYNITFSGTGSTVKFSDSATVIMSGGTFKTSDSVTQSSNKNTFKAAVSGHTWGGLRFTGTNIKMYNSKFENISSPSVNYAVKMLNCPFGDIRKNIFTLNTDTAGAVQSVYLNTSLETFLGFHANYNTVTMNNSRGIGICVQGFSGLTIPIYAMNNTMSSNGYATGIMLSTVTGGAVKKNSMSGFSSGINALGSSCDIFYNTISNSSAVSKGITAFSSSTVNLAPVSGLWLGGFNTIGNSIGSSINIEVDNSVFTLDGGKNTFDITDDADPEAQHLYGEFWQDSYPGNQTENCFKLRGTAITSPDPPYEYITDGSTQLSLTYISYLCGGSLPSNTTVVDLGYGLYDTIPQNSGMGGGMKGNSKSEMRNPKYVLTADEIYDSLRINVSKKNYVNAKSLAEDLIEAYPESWQAISSLQTLYLCVTATDTTSSGITALKNLYEELILNHGSNTALVNIANYMVQKCKVLLHQYSSALSGFQSIINNNEYTYLGLLARWDYMATSLLSPGGGGMSNDEAQMPNDLLSDEFEGSQEQTSYGPDDDKSPFTKEQKQNIRTSIKTALENTAIINNDKVKRLEERTDKGDKKAERELKFARTMKSVIKTEKPKDTFEHIRIVNSDAQKVFGNSQPVSDNKGNNIPTVFRLGQNYPNPFNPATKIAFDLPNDSKVNLVIYDILGREVKLLVNNEVRTAGTYIVDFNASVYASGVYFYRIEAEELNGSKHIDSKKMVLIK